jgi:hypothetical protein
MAEIIGVSVWTAAGLIWGDWRNWKKYHATILFYIMFDFLYYYLAYNYRLWTLKPIYPIQSEFLALIGEAIVFISTILLFLGHYPDRWFAAVKWNILWICIYSVNEWGLLKIGTFNYNHGWTTLDSIIFCIIMFPMLRLHHVRPLLCYLLSVPIVALYIWYYGIPIP